jgi:hypothetical protein
MINQEKGHWYSMGVAVSRVAQKYVFAVPHVLFGKQIRFSN